MALNIKLNVGVATDFNGAVSSRVDNRIALGDKVAPGASLVNASNLEGDLGDDPLSPASTQPGGGAAPDVRNSASPAARPRKPSPSAPQRQALLEPSDRAPPAPIAPTTSAPEIRATPRSPSTGVEAALRDAAAASGIDVNVLRGIASIESSENPASNQNRRTQYKGLFQLNRGEFDRYGGGDIYNARDNAMAAARKFADDRAWFKGRYGREPSDRELYMIHQQGRGFFTRGAMTNIAGNRYPGMRGPQSQASFEAGWGRELKRREDAFRRAAAGKPPAITLK